MTERTSFYRKLAYLVAIVVLAFPLVWLSAPATTTKEGGKLAQLRKNYRLAQVNLGEIDPASETIKFATLGLRGVAVNLLWEKANYYKKVEDWTNLTATLEQLAKLQPNFITFWKFQAWNLTYNVSVEFDDYHDRYYYVRRGIEFLKEGEHYNHFNLNDPQLLWDLGWFIGQKIGRADEYVEYRKLFKADDDFHPPDRTMEERDNWLVGKEWYLKAIDAVVNRGYSLGRKSPRDFYSSPAKSEMNYAEAIEEEGFFDKARRAWQKAGEEWRQFGRTMIEHSTGVRLYLGSQKELEKKVADLRLKLDDMLPGARKELADEKRQGLKPTDRQLLDLPRTQLKPEQFEQRAKLERQVAISDRAVAERIAHDQPKNANAALELASDIEREARTLQYTINYKHDANYDYWQNRADFEQTQNALDARRDMYLAKKAFHDADVTTAKRLYEEGFKKWRLTIDKFPAILDDEQTLGGDILDFIKGYRRVLDQFDEHIPEDFPLWDVIEKFDRENDFTAELSAHKK
ncbi:MAG TPA: hypothetical protein VFW73_08275, partial [Lacipirellulaceae bacterium]|nr:hypothetical protein [Lacipirellulaceae bacterium]